jgi:NAD(P)-dependent dehydrogenase (short-subunit alcohol dehydrogenase family)
MRCAAAISIFLLTPKKVENHLGTNYIGPFLLINLLVSQLEAAGDAWIVNASSAMYQLGSVRFDDYNFSDGKTYNAWEAYAQSKTAIILFAVTLDKKLKRKGIKFFLLHPSQSY